jgi:hypothetical protein
MPGKMVQFDDETWSSLDMLAKDKMMTFQELADEAFRDLLRKHNIPMSLNEALRKSAGKSAEVIPLRKKISLAENPVNRPSDGAQLIAPTFSRCDGGRLSPLPVRVVASSRLWRFDAEHPSS